jgi:hypothetical protein
VKELRPRWLLLAYKVSPEPTRTRVGIWRRIKSLGAIYLQSSVCILPRTSDHERQLKLLQNEIVQAGGIADVLETAALDKQQEMAVVRRFQQDREAQYREFLGKCNDYLVDLKRETQIRNFSFAELQENDEDLKKLNGWVIKIKSLDFYGAPGASEADKRLTECERALEQYASRVYDVEQHSKAGETQERGVRRIPSHKGGRKKKRSL